MTTKRPDLRERNRALLHCVLQYGNQARAAREFGLSNERTRQIIAKFCRAARCWGMGRKELAVRLLLSHNDVQALLALIAEDERKRARLRAKREAA